MIDIALTTEFAITAGGYADAYVLVRRHRGFHRDGAATGGRVGGGAGRSSPAAPGGPGRAWRRGSRHPGRWGSTGRAAERACWVGEEAGRRPLECLAGRRAADLASR